MSSAMDAEQILFEGVSDFNRILVTEDRQGLRALWFGANRVRQSVVRPGVPAHLDSAYPPVMIAGLALLKRVDRVLILGLGGGTIPGFLRAHLPRTRIDVVEVDPMVAAVASRFFGFREDGAMRVHLADARRFLERCDGGYDAIVQDCAGVAGMPPHLMTREFLLSVRRQLAADGICIANIWNRDANPRYDSTVRTFRDVFNSVFFLSVRDIGNQVAFASPRRMELTGEQFIASARSFTERHGLPVDLAACAAYRFRRGEDEQVGGAVLRDPGAA